MIHFFSPSLYKFKEVSLKILCCHNDTWFHLKLTILKPWVNQCILLMEMFVLSCVKVLCIYPRLCLQVSLPNVSEPDLTKEYVILRHGSPNLCKRNYLYGNLPFYKIQINRFMARDDSSGAKIIPKYILWMRGPVPFSEFWLLSFINRLLVTGNPLQYSCLENPRDGRAWCAAIYGVALSRTRLKQLSSSSSNYITYS